MLPEDKFLQAHRKNKKRLIETIENRCVRYCSADFLRRKKSTAPQITRKHRPEGVLQASTTLE
jgi:hypothetical protein